MAARNWADAPTGFSILLVFQIQTEKKKVSFGNRLNASFPRGMGEDLLLEKFRNTEISEGRC